MKKIYPLCLMMALFWVFPWNLYAADTLRLSLQEGEHKTDTAILFRFVPGRLMFYSPYKGNDEAIKRAATLIEQHRKLIEEGNAFLLIRGFCGSYGNKTANLRAAKNRSNQVKSWFITHHGMKEDYYRTRNVTHSYKGIKDVVALLGIEFRPGYEPKVATADTLPPLPTPPDTVKIETPAPRDTLIEIPADTFPPKVETPPVIPIEREYITSKWYIKSNLLYDALLMPSLEVEYRFNERWSAAIEGDMAWWHNNGKHKYYQLAVINPEGRYWFKTKNKRQGHYVGLTGGFGWYDLENGYKGYRGEGVMVGLTYGYMFPVGKYFAFEAAAGLGYMHTWYDYYLPIDGHYVFQENRRLNYFGPIKLRFALVWNVGRWIEKKGGNR